MNTAKKAISAVLLSGILLCGLTATAQKKTITISQLPATAQTFIKTNFAGQKAEYILEDKGLVNTDYEVRLANGIEIEFDGKGNWEEIDGNRNAVPTTLLPELARTYLSTHYLGQVIYKIDKEVTGYEVELANGLEPEFDTSGKFIRLDD